jgi:hypothetical protein
MDRDTYLARLGELRHQADTVLRQQYRGYERRDCWPVTSMPIWELPTLAAEWRRANAVSVRAWPGAGVL